MVPTVLPDLQLHTDDCSSEQICGDLGFISNIFGEDFPDQNSEWSTDRQISHKISVQMQGKNFMTGPKAGVLMTE